MPLVTYIAVTEPRAWALADASGIRLTWVNPNHPFWDHTEIYKSKLGYIRDPLDSTATKIYSGTDEIFIDTDVTGLTPYYYTILGLSGTQLAPYNPAFQLYTNVINKRTNSINWLVYGPTKLDNLWGWNGANSQISAIAIKRYGIGALMYGEPADQNDVPVMVS
jgi:hypothetical protein